MENQENKVETADTAAPKAEKNEKNEKTEKTAETAKKKTEKSDKAEKAEKKCKAELAQCKEEKEKLEKELAEAKDQYLRLAAEYDNFRRRTLKEKEGIYTDAIVDAVKEMLPFFDNLERAAQYKDAEKVAEGLAMMAKLSDGMMEKLGVVRYGKKGDTFNLDLHNAVMHEDNDAYGENEITEVFQEGYRRGDKVIRFAMVKVAN